MLAAIAARAGVAVETVYSGFGSKKALLRAGVALATDIHGRSAGVWRAIVEAAGADPEVEAWRADLERNRRVDVQRALEQNLGRPVEGPMLDVIWALVGPEVYQKLVFDAGMTREAYEDCLVEAVARLTTPARSRRAR